MTQLAPSSGDVITLSEKEKAVMDLLISGATYKEIGAILGVKYRTVVHRVWSIHNKLGAMTREQAAAMYVTRWRSTERYHPC